MTSSAIPALGGRRRLATSPPPHAYFVGERDLPLPRAGARRPPLRAGRAARRRLVPHRERCRDLRPLAPTVARISSADRATRCTVAWLGLVLATMNVCFYVAIDRLPLGTVAAIEFLPVIALAAAGARTVAKRGRSRPRGRGRLPSDRRQARGRRARRRSRLRQRRPVRGVHRARAPPGAQHRPRSSRRPRGVDAAGCGRRDRARRLERGAVTPRPGRDRARASASASRRR